MDIKSFSVDRSKYDHADSIKPRFMAPPGLTEELVRKISAKKNEPEWMLQKRLQGLELFKKTPVPSWGPDLSELQFDDLIYYVDPDATETDSWTEVPEEIRNTFDRLGIPEAEKKALAGVGGQYDSEVVYHKLREDLQKKGVIFENMDVAVQKYPELVKKYFMSSCIPVNDHKFIMLHAAVWSGGTFIYVPENVRVDLPLQAYFRMNTERGGQFEHTLIVVDKGAELHYIEGCFTKGNKVTTNPDYKPVEEIKVGEKVLTHDGSYRRVKEVYALPFEGTLKKIKLTGMLDQIEVTDDHPFLYVDKKKPRERNKEWPIRWNLPRYFERGGYLAIPINQTIVERKLHELEIDVWTGKKNGFKKIKKKVPSTKEFFKLAGYYLAEGSISSGYYLNFSFSNKERELIDDVKGLLRDVFGVTKILEFEHKKNNGINVVVCSVELCRVFEQFGKKANLKSIPQWMMVEAKEKQANLIEAYFKGDGNYYNKRVTSGALKELLRINSVSEKLIRQCQEILLRLGVASFVNVRDRSKENRQKMYTLGISGDHMVKFGKIVGLRIKEKIRGVNRGSRIGISDGFAFYPIAKIESRDVKNELVYNFAVEENETYCVSGAAVHNCSSPRYNRFSLHAGCVELHVLEGAKMRYTSIENWSKNTYNLNTKRAIVHKDAVVDWINGNFGSHRTMLYPSSILVGERAQSHSLGIAFANDGQDQDTGAKVVHAAPFTSSTIRAKSVSKGSGVSSYRGSVYITKNGEHAKSSVNCDALLIDADSVSNTYPFMKVDTEKVHLVHEATVGKIGEEELFYAMARGLSEHDALRLIVSGFMDPIVRELPLEYALELKKLMELELEGAQG